MMSFKIYILISFVCLPLALFSISIPANEQVAFGGNPGGDCDGPLGVMIFSVPSYIIYSLVLSVSSIALIKLKNIKFIATAIFSLCMLAFITPNTIRALEEHKLNATVYEHKCGKGW